MIPIQVRRWLLLFQYHRSPGIGGTDTVHFVDYEYSNSNPAAFDIANHFNEYCGLDPIDFKAYPSLEQQTVFVTAYLAARLGIP